MTLQSLVHKLEAQLQEERGVQGRLLSLLDAQEKAVLAGDGRALEITGSDIERELSTEPRRERNRRELFEDVASMLGVPMRILTVRSIAERLGADGERLSRLRNELEEALLAVRRKAQRISVLARGHQEVLRDVMCLLLGTDGETGDGLLVNAEA